MKRKLLPLMIYLPTVPWKREMELIIPGGEKEEPESLLFQERNYYSSGVAGSGRVPSVIDRNPKGGHSFPLWILHLVCSSV